QDGTDIIVESTAMKLTDGYVSVNRDVTRRKQAEQALRDSEERYRLVSELTSDYVYQLRVNLDGTLEAMLATDGFRRLTGWSLDEVKHVEDWSQFIHPDDLARTGEFFDRVLDTGRPASAEIRVLTKAGKTLWVDLFA